MPVNEQRLGELLVGTEVFRLLQDWLKERADSHLPSIVCTPMTNLGDVVNIIELRAAFNETTMIHSRLHDICESAKNKR